MATCGMLWPLLGPAHVCSWATLCQRSDLNNPVSLASLSTSSVASSALGMQHFSSQKCSELDYEFFMSGLTGLFFPLFSKHFHEGSAVQCRQEKNKGQWTCTRCAKLINKLLLRKTHLKEESEGEESRYSVNHS